MNNPYCASFEKVRDLYVQYMKAESRKNYDDWAKKLTRKEIKKQLDTQQGGLIDGIRKLIKSTTRQTEFVEFVAALQLADFYFPNENKDICFELKRNAKPEDIKTYEDLISSFESYTYIDCEVRDPSQTIAFQIKRDYSDHTPSGFATWLNKKAFKKYSDMKGTSLVVFLGVPTDGSVVEIDKFHTEFKEKCIPFVSFDRVSLLYNDKTSWHMVLHEFYPEHKRLLIESNLAMARFRGDA